MGVQDVVLQLFNMFCIKCNERHFTELLRIWEYLVRYSKEIKKMSSNKAIINSKKHKLCKKGYIIMLLDAKTYYVLHIHCQN